MHKNNELISHAWSTENLFTTILVTLYNILLRDSKLKCFLFRRENWKKKVQNKKKEIDCKSPERLIGWPLLNSHKGMSDKEM